MAFNVPQLTQALFVQKIKHAKCFFDTCDAEMAQSLSSLQKSGTLKLITYFILPLFGVPKLRSVAQNEWKKHPYAHILSTFGLKINKLKRKKMKKQKNQNLKVA